MAATPDTLLGMSFDELMAQVTGESAPATQAAPTQPVQEQAPVPAQTEAAPAGSFEDLLAKAKAQTEPAKETEPVKEPEPVKETAPVENTAPTFDDLVRKAQNAAAQALSPEPDTAPPAKAESEASVETAPPAASSETLVENANTSSAENKTETAMNPPEKPVSETKSATVEEPAKTEPAPEAEPPKAEKPKKPRARKKKETEAKETEAVEPPKDMTAEYEVDILGKSKTDSALEKLFTAEEVAALRKDIRTFVRKELKSAVVDAVKELLHDFD